MIAFLVLFTKIFVGWHLFMHVVGPIIVRRNHRSPANVVFEPLPMDAWQHGENVAVKAIHSDLAALGFSPLTASQLSNSHAQTQFLIYRHPQDGSAAILMCGQSKAGITLVLEFVQRYALGNQLCVNNSPFPSIYPAWEEKIVYRVDRCAEAKKLFAAFCQIREKSELGVRAPLPETGILEMVSTHMAKEKEFLRSRGILEVVGDEERLTRRGAYLVCWKLLWPGKGILRRLEHRRTNQILANSISCR